MTKIFKLFTSGLPVLFHTKTCSGKDDITLDNFSCNLLCRKLHHTETATCLAILLLPQALQKVELDSTFCNNCGNNFIDFFNIAQCNTPCATCLIMLCSISQSGSFNYPLLVPPQSQFCENAGNPIAQCKSPVHATAMLCFKMLRQVAQNIASCNSTSR